MNVDFTPLFEALISLTVALVTIFLLPWLRKKYGTEKTNEILRWVGIFVRAAEQVYNESGMGEKKKEYVLTRLKEKGFTVDVEELDSMIEAAVLELNREAAALGEAG